MKLTSKRLISLILIALLTFSMTACSGISKDKENEENTLTFTLGPQAWGPSLISTLKQKFPDINFNVEYYSGCNTTEYLKTKLLNDDFGDIYFGTTQLTEPEYIDKLMNLSGYSFVGNFEDSIINQYDINGAIYQLPCITSIRTMAYNKTLFREKGWKVPTSHAELVDLCRQIRRESDMTPIAFAGRNSGFYFTTMTTLAQTGFLTTRDGDTWQNAYLEGKTSCKQGFETGISMLQELIDANAYDIDIDDKIDNPAMLMERFGKREAAMAAVWNGQAELVEMDKKSKDEFGLFPFYGRDGQGLLGTLIPNNIGLSKKLEAKGSEKKLENALRIMEWLCTEEGMSHLRLAQTDILTLKGIDNRETIKLYRDVWETNLSGRKAPMLYTGYEDIMNDVGLFIQDAMKNQKSLDGLIELADRIHQKSLDSNTLDSAAVAEIDRNFSHPETVQLVANALDSAGLADAVLLSTGGRKNGITNAFGSYGKLYQGELGKMNYNIPLPYCFNEPLVAKKLTGAEIRGLLEQGRIIESEINGKKVSAAFDYYWAGMDVSMKDGKVESLSIGGKEAALDKTYTILFSANDYYGAGTPSDEGVQLKETPDQLFLSYISKHNPVSAPKVLRQQ